jgi:hypothetical protein
LFVVDFCVVGRHKNPIYRHSSSCPVWEGMGTVTAHGERACHRQARTLRCPTPCLSWFPSVSVVVVVSVFPLFRFCDLRNPFVLACILLGVFVWEPSIGGTPLI